MSQNNDNDYLETRVINSEGWNKHVDMIDFIEYKQYMNNKFFDDRFNSLENSFSSLDNRMTSLENAFTSFKAWVSGTIIACCVFIVTVVTLYTAWVVHDSSRNYNLAAQSMHEIKEIDIRLERIDAANRAALQDMDVRLGRLHVKP